MSKDNSPEKKRQINIKVDQDFFTDVKVKSAKDDITLQDLGEKLLKGWLDGQIKV